VNFAFSEEQEAFRETLRRFLAEKSPTAEIFRCMETPAGYDAAVWKQMAQELGLQGLHLPESFGGQGFGFLELGITLEEMGRALLCAPFFSTVCLAADALLQSGDADAQAAFLPGIASGETVATLALLDEGDIWDPASVTLEFQRGGDGYRLDGAKRLVTDGATAALILVAARQPGTRGPEGITLLAVAADAPGLGATPVESLDATRKLADLRFEGTPARLVGGEGAAAAALQRTLDRACVALAAESAGAAQHCLQDAVDYAKQRVQFARPIGSFQAIKHKCAEVLLEVESARAAAYWACWAAESQPEELPLAASVAKSFCDEAFVRASSENLHVHGGMGFTWESDCHLYLKRAHATSALLGPPGYHRRRIAERRGF
jgi:alkylation response protein AidB-like acyl-CoA dehydrogenase